MGERPVLTVREIEALACPRGKRDMIQALGAPPGFCVRVTRDGTKTFLLQYRRGQAVRRLVLGRVGEVSVADARKLAERARGQVAAGDDPVAKKASRLAAEKAERIERAQSQAADAMTLERLVTFWVERGLKRASKAHRSNAESAIRRALAPMWQRPARHITRKAVQLLFDELAESAPSEAFHVRSYAELAAVWRALGCMAYPFGPLFALLLLTLQRVGEVRGMRWAELAPDFTSWNLPRDRAKNGRSHIIHLSAPARAGIGAEQAHRRSALGGGGAVGCRRGARRIGGGALVVA